MKNQTIFQRGAYAWAGIVASFRSERSFRSQLKCFALVILVLLVTRPAPEWWAILFLTSGGLLAVELLNTAVEKLIDHLHPDIHPAIGVVKDTLAGAVLVMCVTAVAVFAAFLWRWAGF